MKAASSGAPSSRSPRRGRAAAALAAALIFAGVTAGCGTSGEGSATADEPGNEAPPGEGSGQRLGTIELELRLGSTDFLEFDYRVTGTTFARAGTIDVAGSDTVTAIIGGIPFGTNYQVTLHGESSTTPLLTCNGSATTDVASAGVTPVAVPVTCKEGTTASSAVPVPGAANLALCAALLGLGLALVSRKQSKVSP